MVAKTFTSASPEYSLRNLSLPRIMAIAQAFEIEGGCINVDLPDNKKNFRDCFGSGLFWYNNFSHSTCAVSILFNYLEWLKGFPLPVQARLLKAFSN